VWRKSYCPGLVAKNIFKNREQSLDPDVALGALRRFAAWLKKGPHTRPLLTQDQRIQLELLKAFGKKKLARKLAYNIQTSEEESTDSSSDDDGSFFVPPKVKKKKKRTQPSIERLSHTNVIVF